MGEVYRARDTKLGRSVAIKVLPEALAADADRITRFEREAQALEALDHPHIAILHGMEQAAGRHFLVMELVEDETLAERLLQGALPLDAALRIEVVLAWFEDGMYMNEDPEAPNYDPVHKVIKSIWNGSRGPMLRQATVHDWVGDPVPGSFHLLHNSAGRGKLLDMATYYPKMLAHCNEYLDSRGDNFLNLAATILGTNIDFKMSRNRNPPTFAHPWDRGWYGNP